jgi:hypothetical protein
MQKLQNGSANVPQDFLVYLGKVFGITAVVLDF